MKRTFRIGSMRAIEQEQESLDPDGIPHAINNQRGDECSETNDRTKIHFDPAWEMILPLWMMKMTQSAYCDALTHMLAIEPEAAGILLGPAQDDLLVTHFIPDLEGNANPASFRLHAASLNKTLKRVKPAGLNCKGIVHSHPSGICQPSLGDVAYLKDVFKLAANVRATQFFMPIVCDGRMFPYVFAGGRVWIAEMALV